MQIYQPASDCADEREATAVRTLAASLGVELDDFQCRHLANAARDLNRDRLDVRGCCTPGPGRWGWSEGSWRTWLKNRLSEYHLLPAGGEQPAATDGWASATLHVFFVHLEETPDMLKLLRNEPKEKPKPAGRRPSETAQVLTPINKTAANVFRPE